MAIRGSFILSSFLIFAGMPLSVAIADPGAPVKIGVMATLSGDFAKYGELVRTGVTEGAVGRVQFVFEDEGCEPAKAVAAFHKLADIDKVTLFIGPVCGSSQQAVVPLLKTRNVVAVFPASAPRDVFTESGSRAFSSQYSIESESAFNASAIYALHHSRVVILATASEFSRAHEAAFRAHFKGKVLDLLLFPRIDKETLRGAVLKIKTLNPDALYVPDASPFFFGLKTQLNQMGLSSLPVFSVYSAQSADMLAAEGASANGLMYSYPEIGTADAINYFPKIAAEILTDAALECKGAPECVRERFLKSGKFDADGTLQGAIKLRVVRDGKFGATVDIPKGDAP